MPRRVALAFALALLVAPPASAQAQIPNVYVALGDSFTAAPLVPLPTGDPIDCGQSTRNYPRLLAAALDAPVLRDASCNGADTDDLYEPHEATFGSTNPPQFDRLGPDVALVTVGIGGNDIGFGSIVSDCVQLPGDLGARCTDIYVHDGRDELAERIAATKPVIVRVLRDIRTRAPNAKIFLRNYPSVIPETGSGCYPYVPIRPDDLPYLRTVQHGLNDMLAAAAKQAGAGLIDWFTPSIGHDVCQLPTVAWVNGAVVVPLSYFGHPNELGEAGAAAAAERAIRASGFAWPTSAPAPAPVAAAVTGDVATDAGHQDSARTPDTGGLPAVVSGAAVSAMALGLRRRL